jgi:hypothetical protein
MVPVYLFEDLEEDAQRRAVEDAQDDPYRWEHEGYEYWQAGQDFHDRAGAPIRVTEVWWECYVHTKWREPSDTPCYDRDEFGAEFLTGLRAWKWLENNGWFYAAEKVWEGEQLPCGMGGVYTDWPLFDPIREYARKPLEVPTLREVFTECIERWRASAESDMEYRYSDECIREEFVGLETEFYKDGRIA